VTRTPITSGVPLPAGICSLAYQISTSGSCERRAGFPSWSWLGWRDDRGIAYDYWIETYGAATYPVSRLELQLPKVSLSRFGRREIGHDWVEVRQEATIVDISATRIHLRTQRAFFEIRRVLDQGDELGRGANQVWELLDRAGRPIPVIKGRWILSADGRHKLVLPQSYNGGAAPVRCELLLLQRWSEHHGRYGRPSFGDVVEAIAISRTWEDDKVLRIGSVALPHACWVAAEPDEVDSVLD
jgi:hypothetical protein